ncbi:uncharacterized protein JCM15063_004839 [Sporobolomyces koalae]|uniref:uncharacterized protein n=1 Tax=Sporobolomyces koalae TaxID=500713 RepID=UPI0031753EEF
MSRTTTDRYQRQVLELVKQPGNNQCADCRASSPRWASWDQGVFLCVKCASMHRKIGSHITKVKSLTLDTWTKEQVDNMRKLGNVKVNSLLNPDERRNPPPPPDSDGDSRNSELERFVRNKYEYKVYQDFDSVPPASPSLASPPPPPSDRTALPPRQYNGIPSMSNLPPPPVRTDSRRVYSPPVDPPPPLPSRTSTNPSPAPFFSGSFAPAQTISAVRPKAKKSVRFPETAPIQIPSPPDSDDEDDESRKVRPQSRHRSLAPTSQRSILVRTPGVEIPIDWAALTRDSSQSGFDDDEQGDVPLQALGALGRKGAQVGLVAVPAQGGMMTPMAMYGAGGGGSQYQQPQAGMKPLMPQYTGSARGYLHQMHAGTFNPPAPLQPQMTGSVSKHYQSQHAQPQPMDGDSFMRMFQPPTTASSFQPPPPNRTNPFTRFAQSAPPEPEPQPLRPAPTGGGGGGSIWDDLGSLAPTPPPAPQPLRPQLTGFVPTSSFGQQLLSSTPEPSPTTTSAQPFTSSFLAPPPAGTESQRTGSPLNAAPAQPPSPLKPQYTGFVPSSSFGQHLQHESSSASQPGPLQPQRTGFVPSSSFGQQLAKDLGGSTERTASPGLFDLNPTSNSGSNSTNPQFAPPTSTSTEKNQPSPGLFDFDFFATPTNTAQPPVTQPSPSRFLQSQPPPNGRTDSPAAGVPNPFSNFSNSLGSTLPTNSNGLGPAPSQQYLQPQPTGSTNPFLRSDPNSPSARFNQPHAAPSSQMRPQLTGYGNQGSILRPQVTGFAGGGGGTNPFLMMQPQQQIPQAHMAYGNGYR